MSSFHESKIDEGFSDEMEYMDYLDNDLERSWEENDSDDEEYESLFDKSLGDSEKMILDQYGSWENYYAPRCESCAYGHGIKYITKENCMGEEYKFMLNASQDINDNDFFCIKNNCSVDEQHLCANYQPVYLEYKDQCYWCHFANADNSGTILCSKFKIPIVDCKSICVEYICQRYPGENGDEIINKEKFELSLKYFLRNKEQKFPVKTAESSKTSQNTGYLSTCEPIISNNHNAEFIDMGLSVKWAKCNLGASSPEEYGRYYTWGDLKGQTWNGKAWSNGGRWMKYKYVDYFNQLSSNYDAAHKTLGGKWRIPTKEEFQELVDNCEIKWYDDLRQTGIPGAVFTSKKNGNELFLPAAGYGIFKDSIEDMIESIDSGIVEGSYWSSSYDESGNDCAWHFMFWPDGTSLESSLIDTGMPIRPILDSQ